MNIYYIYLEDLANFRNILRLNIIVKFKIKFLLNFTYLIKFLKLHFRIEVILLFGILDLN